MNIYNKVNTTRKPRVHITYDIEDLGSTVKKELPFVVGVLGDFSGDSKDSLKPLKQRKFVNIYGDNFEQVMSSIAPSVKTRVKNTLKNDGSQIPVELTFKSMDDFSPAKIAEKIPSLKKLLEIRAKLNQLVSKTERSEELEEALSKLLQSEESLKDVMNHLNASNSSSQVSNSEMLNNSNNEYSNETDISDVDNIVDDSGSAVDSEDYNDDEDDEQE